MIRATTLILLLTVTLSPSAQAQQCSSDELNAYMKCVADNPCECSDCDPDPVDGTPEIIVNNPRSCQDISRVFCPLIKCCQVCEEVAAAWYTCSFQGFSTATLGTSCPETCSGFKYGDGDCGDGDKETLQGDDTSAIISESVNAVDLTRETQSGTDVCATEVDDYKLCIVTQGCDSSCNFDMSGANTALRAGLKDPCGNEDIFCPALECCPKCDTSLEAMAACMRTDYIQVSEDAACSPLVSFVCDALSQSATGASVSTSTSDSAEETAASSAINISSVMFPSSLLALIAAFLYI